AWLHRQQHFQRLGSHLAPNDLGPALAVGIFVRTLVVNLRDVSGSAVQKDDDRVLAVVALNGFFEIVNVVGGDAAGAGGGVAGKVDDAAQESLLLVPAADDADLRIGRAGRLDDVGVAKPGMRDGSAIAHLEAAVESDGPLD